MMLRLHEVHPFVVHVPLAMLPIAVGADLVGVATGDRSLLAFARKAIGIAAVGAGASALTGLVAAEEVNEGDARDMLITHRNLNLTAVAVASGMAAWRAGHEKPSAAYLGIGAIAVGVLAYTAYLGGKVVYETGAGVRAADGVYREDAPALGKESIGAVLGTAAEDLAHGVQHMAEELRQGEVVPAITGGDAKDRSAPAQFDR